MNAYRKIKFTTPAQYAGYIAALVGMYATMIVVFIFTV